MPLELQADLGKLSEIRDYVSDAATALGTVPGALDDLRLAVDEAVTNLLTHGYEGPGKICLQLAADGPDLVVRLRDSAPPFYPETAAPVDLRPPGDRDNPGGYGLFLIRSAMDEVRYRQTDHGNELEMIKRSVIRA